MTGIRRYGEIWRTSLEQLGLVLGVLVQLVLTLAVFGVGFGLGLVFLLPGPIEAGRRVTNRQRRIVGRWTGIEVGVPYTPRPAPPVPEPDGLYRHETRLYRTPRVPRFFNRLTWVLEDKATGWDLLWLLAHPIVGGFLAALPYGLVGLGGYLAVTRVWYFAGLAVLGLLIVPLTVRAYGWWARIMLRPSRPRGPWRAWVMCRFAAFIQSAALLALSALSAAVLAIVVLGLVLSFGLGLVVFVLPPVLENLRWLPRLRRYLAGTWSGTPIPEPYRRRPELPVPRPDGLYRIGKTLYRSAAMARFTLRYRWLLHDPATWRDLLWLLVDPIMSVILLLPGAGLVIYGIWGQALPSITSHFGAPHNAWYGEFAGSSALAIPVGVLLALLGLVLAPRGLRPHGWWTGLLLAPTKSAALTQRVAHLTETRGDAVDAQAAEVRRIERDLHDGAQARLVSVGLTLGAAERLLQENPESARALLAQARESSATALAELRDLVRGIHPPVLAERGLGDAVRAVALDCPLPVRVAADLPSGLPAPVESAAYFAVCEALTNAVRHAGAQHVSIDLRHRDGVLAMAVTDDGHGGADPDLGTGLHGIRRRLGTFDGSLTVHSPPGGPTVVRMELPCGLSSPKTSTSSGTD